ncbi:uncharacterized protein [Typha latifolia]|uniref:uncharacterized protein isoform X1 n=1 Tax=Typha latifolia TaxID=4733 RepID=UPI003C2C1CA8
MTTLEHLFMQIFERKNWIECQLRQQIESYGESLAYNLVADGKRPPPWLWTTGLDAPGCPNPKELDRKHIVSDFLFPPAHVTTPANCSTFFTLPKEGAKVSQNGFLAGTCFSNECICPEYISGAASVSQSKEVPLEQRKVDSEVAEAYDEFNMFSRIQRSRSRQRDLENRLSEKAKAKTSGRGSSLHIGIMTRSRVASMRSDKTEESPVVKLIPDMGDDCRVTQPRQVLKALDSHASLSKPAEPLKHIADNAHVTSETEDHSCPDTGADVDNLTVSRINCNVASQRCPAGTVPNEPVADHSRLRVASTLSASVPEDLLLVEPKKLLFDGIDLCVLNESSFTSSIMEDQDHRFTSQSALPDLRAINSVEEETLSSNSMKGGDSSTSQLLQRGISHNTEDIQCIREANRVSDGSPQEDPELLGQQNPECLSLPPCGKPSHVPSRSLSSQGASQTSGNSPSRSCPLKDSKMSPANLSSHPGGHLTDNSEGSFGRLPENATEAEKCELTAANRDSDVVFSVETENLLHHTVEQHDLNGNHLTCLGRETKDSDSGNAISELELVVSAEEEPFDRELNGASVCPELLQEKDPLHTLDVNEVFHPQMILCNNIDIPTSASLDSISRNNVSENIFLSSPISCTTEQKSGGAQTKEITSSPGLMDTVHNDGLLFTETKEASVRNEEDKISTVELQKKTNCQLPTFVQTAENQDAALAYEPILSSYNEDKFSGSSKLNGSTLSSLSRASDCLSADGTVGTNFPSNSAHNIPKYSYEIPKFWNDLGDPTSINKNLAPCNKNLPFSEKSSSQVETDGYDICESMSVAEKNCHSCKTMFNDAEIKNLPPSSRYVFNSLGSYEKNSSASDPKQSVETEDHSSGISEYKRRKMSCLSNYVLATSPKTGVRPSLNSQEGNDRLKRNPASCCASTNFQLVLPSKMEDMSTNVVEDCCLDVIPQSKEECRTEGSLCVKAKDHDEVNHLQHKGLSFQIRDLDEGITMTSSKVDVRTIESTPSRLTDCASKEEGLDQLGAWNTLYPSNIAISSHCVDDIVDCNETMPEYEGFSIGFPSVVRSDIFDDSEVQALEKERASLIEQLCDSRNLVIPGSHPSTKYKINKLPDVYQSLPTSLLNLTSISNPFLLDVDDIGQFSASENRNASSLDENCGSEVNGIFLGRTHYESMSFSSARIGHEISKPPLTPPVEKFNQRKLSGRSGASSGIFGSNPELTCFRIDEDISATEENDHHDVIYISEEKDCSEEIKSPTNRKALQDVTALYQNAPALVSLSNNHLENSSLKYVKTEALSNIAVGRHLSPGNACASKKKSKRNHSTYSVSGIGIRKVGESLRSRSSKMEISGRTNEGKRSQTNMEKGCRPNNIVSNVSSFLPLVRQKQQAATVKGKKDIKVKALEMAEAAKRIEEKKLNEREMRKAAAKVERIRLGQEKELKQKQEEEQRKKKEADIAARKRQREEEEKKEKEKRRRCIEEARKPQREQVERTRAGKEENDPHYKASELRKKDLVEEGKRPLKLDKEEEVAGCKEARPGTVKVVGDGRLGDDRLPSQDTSKESSNLEKSYEMSPYRDSDDEEEEEGELKRRRKSIPSWARREFLDQILLSKQHLDPKEIFSRKSSFDLNEVLSPRVPHHQL